MSGYRLDYERKSYGFPAPNPDLIDPLGDSIFFYKRADFILKTVVKNSVCFYAYILFHFILYCMQDCSSVRFHHAALQILIKNRYNIMHSSMLIHLRFRGIFFPGKYFTAKRVHAGIYRVNMKLNSRYIL
jgi:hypothetical protein